MSLPKVYLVGAGPGDPDLLTIKARRILLKADVVLYDYLVHPTLLALCKPDAVLSCVGKRKGEHSKKQAEIHQIILENVKKKRLVVRLKGGDPLIFGRGGEEMTFLAEHQIPFEVIPGVSSAIAVPAYAGIPLTHRDLSRSVAFVTGTLSSGEAIEAEELPDADTLVVMMAVSQLERLVHRVLRLKRFSEVTPAALISCGTTAAQAVLRSTLGDIVQACQSLEIRSPSLLVIGEVAGLSEALDWRGKLPLSGKRVILLRSRDQSTALHDELSLLGAEVVHVPMLAFRPLKSAVKALSKRRLQGINQVIFTSQNAVIFFKKALLEKGLDVRVLADKTIVAVGPKTVSVLEENGLRADRVPERFSAQGILASLGSNLAGQKILVPAAQQAKPELAEGLQEAGAIVWSLPLYTTECPKQGHNFSLSDGDTVVFSSESTVHHFFESGLYHQQAIHAICISEQVRETLSDYYQGVSTVIASGLLSDLSRFLDSAHRGHTVGGRETNSGHPSTWTPV